PPELSQPRAGSPKSEAAVCRMKCAAPPTASEATARPPVSNAPVRCQDEPPLVAGPSGVASFLNSIDGGGATGAALARDSAGGCGEGDSFLAPATAAGLASSKRAGCSGSK